MTAMSEESEEEMAYNEEVARLVSEGMKCPTCNEPPIEIERISAGHGAMAVCRRDHHYYLKPTEDL